MTPDLTPEDQRARDRIRTSLDESLIVEAAAGTGKTSELVRRIGAVVRTGRGTVDGIVAVTFTRKAAGELKLRLRNELDRSRFETEIAAERKRLEAAMVRLEEAHIGTIHSFCADILHERPIEAGIQPGFEELDENESQQLFERVFNRWAQDVMDDPSPALRRALARAADWDASRPPLERLRREAWKVIEWRDFPSSWRREEFDREASIDVIVNQIDELAQAAIACPKAEDLLRQALAPAVEFAGRIRRQEKVRSRDYDELEATLVRILTQLGRNKRKGRGKFSEKHSREAALQLRASTLEVLEKFRRRSEADLAASLREEFRILVERYDDAKRRAGKLDFMDLLISARDLLRSSASVRQELQERFTHIFVDEFQDTDPLQAEILLVLASDDPRIIDTRRLTPVAGKLFLVGDPKQSIYRFRRADFTLYRSLRESLTARSVGLVYLTASFRAVPNIQRAVNAAFSAEMVEDLPSGQPQYTPLGEQSAAVEGQPALVALPVARPYGWTRISKKAVSECLPDTIAAWISWLLRESGWRVRDPVSGEQLLPVRPQHVAILFRRFVSWGDDITRAYVHALEGRGIPHLLQGARSFHQREEVETLRAALSAIEWPDDELSVFATLKGSLFAISDADLLAWRQQVGPFTLVPQTDSVPPGDELRIIHEALGLLGSLHHRRNSRPFAETVNALLGATRAHAGFALRPAGNQILANVYRIADMARRFDAQGGTSFRGFVQQLIREAEAEDGGHSPVLEEGADGVRVMTVHAAKGLEFPVVILADITANIASARPDKHVDPPRGLAAMRLLGCAPWELIDNHEQEHLRDRSEGVRIAYVAATRARDVLVVPTIGDGPLQGWTEPLNKALYPAGGQARRSIVPTGCPEFKGDRTVLERPPGLNSDTERSVRPGLHRPGPGRHDVVWWDPALLATDQKASFGILQEHILTSRDSGGAAERSLRDYRDWRSRREQRTLRGSRPWRHVFAPSDPAAPAPDVDVLLKIERTARVDQRPGGRRFGSLVHLLLRDGWGVRNDVDALESLSEFHGRVLDAPGDERAAAVTAVSEAFRHPLLRRAAAVPKCHREYPVTLQTESGQLMDGVIDLLFEDGECWHVVDFKTDGDLDAQHAAYRTQIGWYVQAVSAAMGQPAKGYILSL